MKFPKVGDLRVKAFIDFEGDYAANVQIYRGFFSGWRNLKAYYATRGREPDEAVRLAKQHIAALKPVQVGVIK